jgi:hypothetical protein
MWVTKGRDRMLLAVIRTTDGGDTYELSAATKPKGPITPIGTFDLLTTAKERARQILAGDVL